jgi:hypothetical protein
MEKPKNPAKTGTGNMEKPEKPSKNGNESVELFSRPYPRILYLLGKIPVSIPAFSPTDIWPMGLNVCRPQLTLKAVLLSVATRWRLPL